MAVILLYHRIGITAPDPWALNVAPENFQHHLRFLRRHLRPVAMQELLVAAAEGASLDDAVAVTFDDGYADNLQAALPLLERYEIPATFFIPTGAIDSVQEFWWDELERLILEPAELPPVLRITIGGDTYEYKLGATAKLTRDEAAAAGWVAWETPPTARHALYADLWSRCQGLAAVAREDVMCQVRAWATDGGATRPARRTLSAVELRRLAASPIAEIGAHTITHPSLASLSLDEQKREIVQSRDDLESLIGGSVRTFSYPFGKSTDYTSETIGIVRDAGYHSACANIPGVVSPGVDTFQLPRLFVRDMDGPRFRAWLSWEVLRMSELGSWLATRLEAQTGLLLDLYGLPSGSPPTEAGNGLGTVHANVRRTNGDAAIGASVMADMQMLPFAVATFDLVLAGVDAATPGADPVAVLGEVLRVLRPGGRLLLLLKHAANADLWRWNRGRFLAVSRDTRGDVVCHELMAPDAGRHGAAKRLVDLGQLRTLEPVSRQFGFDRGLPIDRHYIEAFLARHASDIRDCVLEIGDDTYTWRYGGDRVTTSDVLHVLAGHPRATVVGDLAKPTSLPTERYDCIICTQTLHLVYDLRTAVRSLRQMLKPGGVLLATFPGISQIAEDLWGDTWYWSLTPLAARRVFGEGFGPTSIDVSASGNVLAAVAFLEGLASDELSETELEHGDPSFPLVVTTRALRPREPGVTGLEIMAVSRPVLDDRALAGAYLDAPVEGQRYEDGILPVRGWVVGHDAPVRRIEVTGECCSSVSAAVELDRPDVQAHLPALPWSLTSGFAAHLNIREWPGGTLRVRAVMAGGGSLELGTLTARRAWREETHGVERDIVSAVIPCFNQAHYLAEAIESVLKQTYPHVEVVVIDDGSTDNTGQIAARYPGVKYVRQVNRGLAAARNEGLRCSNGNYVLFLDADDTLEPEGVAHGVECLRDHPDAAFAYGRFRRTDAGDAPLPAEPHAPLGADPYANLLRGNHIGMHATVLYRRAVFQVVKGFDERLEACEDYDLYFRIARRLPIVGHPHLVARYRRHEASMSSDMRKMLRVALEVLGRQRTFLRRDPSRRAAYRDGRRNWRQYYGRQVLAGVLMNVRQKKVGAATLRDLWLVGRHVPGELLTALWTRLNRSKVR